MTTQPSKTTSSNRPIIAVGIGVAMLAVILAISHHPVSHGATLAEKLVSMQQQSFAAQAVHGVVMLLLAFLTIAMAALSDRLGLRRPAVALALLLFVLATVQGCIAMTFDGFVTPLLAARCLGGMPGCADTMAGPLMLAAAAVQAFTRLSLLATALAVGLCSAQLIAGPRLYLAGAIGLASATLQLVLLAGVATVLTPHTLIIVLAAQLAWYGVAVWVLLRPAA